MKNNKLMTRWLIYVAGMSIQGLGLYLNARCGLDFTRRSYGLNFFISAYAHLTPSIAALVIPPA